MIRILNWPNEDLFALYKEQLPEVVDGNRIELSLLANNQMAIRIGKECFAFTIVGNWEQMNDGDIISIRKDGLVNRIYKKGQAEIDLFLTNQCNSNCLMCPLTESVRKKKYSGQYQWISDLIEVLPEDIPFINITGGEPTLEINQFLRIMRQIKVKFQKSEFQLLTNGRSFSDNAFLMEALLNMPNHIRFAIPLHSGIESVHDRITQSSGSFRQTDRGIKNLLSNGQKVEIRIVLSKLNIESVRETVRYIAKQYPGVFVVNFVGMEMMGNAIRNRILLWEDYAMLFQRIKEAVLYLISKGIDTQLYNFPLCAIDRGYWTLAVKSITDYKIRYKEECGKCAARSLCGGFFMSTLKIIDPEVKVIDEL